MSNFPIRKYCQECLKDYRIVSTANECKICKNKLTIEFDVTVHTRNLFEYDKYTDYIFIHFGHDIIPGNTPLRIKEYNYKEILNNIEILENIYQEILNKENIYLKCVMDDDKMIRIILTNSISKLEKKYYVERRTANSSPIILLIHNNKAILQLSKIWIMTPNGVNNLLLLKDDFEKINKRIDLTMDDFVKINDVIHEQFTKLTQYMHEISVESKKNLREMNNLISYDPNENRILELNIMNQNILKEITDLKREYLEYDEKNIETKASCIIINIIKYIILILVGLYILN